MAPKTSRRRSPGEGGCWPYQTKAGERFRVKGLVRLPDGTLKEVNKRGFMTKTAGLEWLGDQQSAGRKGEYLEPSRQRFGAYCAEVIDGMRIGPQTKASYLKNLRNRIEAYPIAAVPLAQLTGQRLTVHYRLLEKSGRKDRKAGEALSARTVRYIHTIIHGVLGQAVNDGLLLRNPADAATPPTAKEAKAPEMHPWDAGQLAAFLGWAEGASQSYALWHLLAMTGMRRGEALALRWRGSMALQLITPGSLVFGDIEGQHRNPEHVSRQFLRDLERCGQVPAIRLHGYADVGISMTCAIRTPRCFEREPVHVVSQRLGHASPMVTLTVYAHVMPGNQRETANTFARLVREARGA